MCGIVGLISKGGKLPTFADDLFTDLVRMDTVRGPDSTGVLGVTDSGHVDIVKGNANGYRFVEATQYIEFQKRIRNSYRVVVGHNRKATKGSITAFNAHPFHEEHIYMVHNGMMRNANDVDKTVEVDSMAIAKALATHDASAALKKIDGAYALAWFDQKDKTLNLTRNDERPLFLVEYEFVWILSSELGLPLWLMGREGKKPISTKLLEPLKILVFNLKDLKAGYKEVAYEEYTHWTPPAIVIPTFVDTNRGSHVMEYPRRSLVTTGIEFAEVKMKALGWIPNTEITIKVDDWEIFQGANILLGHPVIKGVLDEQIIIRVQLRTGENTNNYIDLATKGALFKTKVCFWKPKGVIPVVYTKDIQLSDVVNDVGGKEVERLEVEAVLKNNTCGRCNLAINLLDIEESIVRKSSDGKWRLLCKTCLKNSKEIAAKKQETLHVVH